MRALLIGMMAVTFVLGVGVLSLVFVFGRVSWQRLESNTSLSVFSTTVHPSTTSSGLTISSSSSSLSHLTHQIKKKLKSRL